MRPHRLRMTAFGPFAGTVEVDLDRLAAGGLFLLHGETGAGKTTLLDGLGFALYGTVPGPRQQAGRLRSDHADPAVHTQVQLEVTLGGRDWRITRSPAHERPKQRGTGTTTEPAKVLLEVASGGAWQTVSTRFDETAGELDALLGMSADQFFQVVLLPQGEFARFLRGNSKERGELLRRLFATQRFQDVEDWLAARRAATAAAVLTARQGLQVLAGRLAQAAGLEPPEEPTSAWLHEVVEQAERSADALVVEASRATVARDGARRQAEAVRALAERQGRRRAALAGVVELDAQAGAHAQLGEELRAAARAAELAPVLAQAAVREATLARATAAEAVQRARLVEVALPVGSALPELRAAGDAARERAGRLAGLRGLADDLRAERDLEAEAAREAVELEGAGARFVRLLAALPQRRAAAQADAAASRAAAARLPEAQAATDTLRTARTEAQGLADVLLRSVELREEHLSARETLVSLREQESELREARLTSMVAELADTLVPGVPCEVCGSPNHPDPYEGASDGVTREDEERARLAADDAARRVAELDAALAAAGALAQAHRQRLAESGLPGAADAGVDELAQRCAAAAADLQRCRLVAAGLAPAEAAVDRVEAEQAAADTQRAAAHTALAATVRRGAEAGTRAERVHARLALELAGAPDLAAAAAATARTRAVCDAVVEAASQAGAAAHEATAAAADAARSAAAAGFADLDDARAALRDEAWRERAARGRRAHDDRRAQLDGALADPDLDVPLEPVADPAAATSALEAADRVLTSAVGALAAAERRAAEVAVLAPQILVAQQDLAPLEARAALARRLGDLCAGGGANALKMTLSSFVLAARLEEVAAAASGRLLRMTQGRYTLVHTDGAARGGARSGLGLLVRDSWTGRDRETSTLSGGETFQASLALALGLADVVQAEAGGTRIDALFVDEGFGTLDDETLDEVMDVLDGLREGGRVVALVSHVAELKARIPAQVHVVKGRTGSTLTTCGC